MQFFDFLGNSLIAGTILVLIYYLHYRQPVAFIYFFSEDSWSEYLTFMLFLFSSIFLIRAMIKDREFRKPGFFGLALISLLIAMEEISWGQRIFNFALPGFFHTLNTQSELNLHNFFQSNQYYPYIGNSLILFTMVLPILTRLSGRVRNLCARFGIPIVSIRHWPFFAVPIFLLDYYRYSPLKLSVLYEIVEFSIAIAVSIVVKDLVLKPDRKAYGGTSNLSTIKMMVIVVICTVPLVVFFRNESHIKYRLNRYSIRDYPVKGMYRQAGIVFDYIDRHPQFQKRDFQYHHGLIRLKLGRNEEAKKTLNKALEEEEEQLLEKPNNPEGYRNKGKILHVLGRDDEAKMSYLKAIEFDCQLLREVDDRKTEAEYRWSLGKTLFAMGRQEAADEQIKCAAQIAPTKGLWKKILYWLRDERRKAIRLMPSEMKRIDVDLPPKPCEQNAQDDKQG